MSEDKKADKPACCASDGIAEVDDIKLVPCDGCDLVSYCSDECQKDHIPDHKEDCKKRAAELRDELLFKQPESSHMGDCPICMIPLKLDMTKSVMMNCCSKIVCTGCVYANEKREDEMRLDHTCPFCREPVPKTNKERYKQMMKRVEANDPVAVRVEASNKYNKGHYSRAFTYWTQVAELGDANAHFRLSCLYRDGRGVEKDEGKKIYHLEEAVIGGHPDARHNLGNHEWSNGNFERAVQHFVIAATQGNDRSIKWLINLFKEGHVSKDSLANTLRAHQAAADETKSPQREVAEMYYQSKGFL